jgi:ABC-type glycerol-3-phosphate transport system permease component
MSQSNAAKALHAIRHHWVLYLFVLPAIVLVAIFQYYPAASGIFHSFFRWNGDDISEFNRGQNYVDLVNNTAFWRSFELAFILGTVNVLKMIPAIIVAVCIHRCVSAKAQFFYRVAFVAPMVVPGLVVALIWRTFFFDATFGLLNPFLQITGLMTVLQWISDVTGWGAFQANVSPAWLGSSKLILPALIIYGLPWIGSFAILIHLAKLQQISKDVYEAADIDGIGWFGKFTRIELPLILGSIHILLVFVIIDTIKDAGTVLALAGVTGGPGGAATVPALFMFQRAFVDQQMGFACAIGVVITVVVLMLQKITDVIIRKDNQGPNYFGYLARGCVTLVGALMIYSGSSLVIGVPLLMVGLPWELIVRFYQKWDAARLTSARLALGDSKYIHKPLREQSPAERKFWNIALSVGKHGTILAVLFIAYLPIWLMIVVSLKSNQQFYADPLNVTFPLYPENWTAAFKQVLPSVANTLYFAGSATVLILMFGLMSAYFFARRQMPFQGVLWTLILLLMMMPTIANLIPLFGLLRDLGLLNSLSALILVGASGGVVFATFVLKNFVADIPKDLFEAADIDGASHFKQMWQVVLPLSGPALGTVAIMQFIAMWNEFILPLVAMRDADKLPVMVQLLRLAGEYIKFWGPLMAGYAMASLPVIILFTISMRLFVRGLTEGGVKG